MAVDKAIEYKMQGGVKNYRPSKMVTAPRIAKSSPDTPTAKLAYITPEEEKILIDLNLYGSLKGKPNRGPSGIPSLEGDFGGPGGYGGYQGGGGGRQDNDVSGSRDRGTGDYRVTDRAVQDAYNKNRAIREANERAADKLAGRDPRLSGGIQTNRGPMGRMGGIFGSILGMMMGIPGLGLLTGGFDKLKGGLGSLNETLGDFREKTTGYRTQAEYDAARQQRQLQGRLDNMYDRKSKGKNFSQKNMDMLESMGLQPSTAQNVLTGRDLKGFTESRGLQTPQTFSDPFANTVGTTTKVNAPASDAVSSYSYGKADAAIPGVETTPSYINEFLNKPRTPGKSSPFSNFIDGLYNPEQIAALENEYGSKYGITNTSGGISSDARHMAAMNNLSNSLSPFNNKFGNFIGDTGAFAAGLINELPALGRGFNKENLGEIVEDIKANYAGSFGTPNQTTAEQIYGDVFEGSTPARTVSVPTYGTASAEDITIDGGMLNSPFMETQIGPRVIAAENAYYNQGKMPPEFLGDRIRMNMELGNRRGFMGPGFAEGGIASMFTREGIVNRTQSFIKFVKDFLEGPDAKKPISIPELVELHNKKYPKNKIKRLADGGYGSIANSALNYNPKLKNKLNLISGNIARRALEDAPLSGLLEGTGYTRKNLITEIKEGKTLREIADNLYKNNKSYFDKLPIREFKDKGVTRKLDRVTQIINTLSGNVSTDLNRGKVKPNFKENKELQKILNTTNLKKEKQLKNALSDVKNFINKNKNKYSKAIDKGGFGVPYKFQEDILNFVEKKYPNLISISDGKAGREPVLKGQRLLPNILFGKKESKLRTTMGGEYARNTNLKRMIFKSLNLPFDLKEGEGVYNAKNYNSLVKKLLPAAQKKGFVPKTYVDKRGIKRLITANNYNNYVRYKSTDPLFEVFGKQIYFSPEHTGGLKRAVLLNDPEALRTVAPMQSFREEIVSKNPNIEKGQSFDKKITGQISNIINSSDLERPKFIQAANNLAKEAAEKYGVPQATYSWDNVNKKLITKYPKINLESSLLDKVKSAINNFISNDGIKKPVFKKLPKKIQEAVLLTNEGKSATSSIQSHLKDLRLPGGPNLLSRIATKGGVGAVLAVIGLSALGGGSAEATEVSQQQINQPTVGEPLKYDATQGSIVNANTDQKADQNQILEYVKDNPLKVTAGTSLGFAAQEVPGAYKAARDLGRGRVRSTLGISGAIRPVLTTFGTPLITGLYEGAIGAKRLEDGETMTDILTDPLGPALGISLMEPLSKLSGVVRDAPKRTMLEGAKNYFNLSNVGQARPGITGQILRMGLSPRMIAGASRFLGLPGLALGLGMSGYDAYKNYQNQEGMIYNLFNKDG